MKISETEYIQWIREDTILTKNWLHTAVLGKRRYVACLQISEEV
jgi:hypothetical protein